MKNFIVASVLGKGKQNHGAEQQQQADQVINKNRGANKGGQIFQQQTAVLKNVGRRPDVQHHPTRERPRGKSCDRLMQNRNENCQHYGSEWSDDGGFAQWRAIHHRPTNSSRPETYYHHARPISVSITDRIQFVLRQQDRQQQQSLQQQQLQIEHAFQMATNQGFQKPFTSQYYPEYRQYPSTNSNGTMGMNGWAYQSGGSSGEEAVGPKSLDSEWALQRQTNQQQQLNDLNRVNHPNPSHPALASDQQTSVSALSRKVSTYGTLPRNRQRFFTAKYHSK